jgi:hypothetical protein
MMSPSSLSQAHVLFKSSDGEFKKAALAESYLKASGDDAQEDETPEGREKCRAIFISDLHIGTPGFQADALLDF